jgi:RND family efflux transporter MFP subunit
MTSFISSVSNKVANINWRSRRTIALILVALIIIAGGVIMVGAQNGTEEVAETPHLRSVELASVGALSSDTAPLPAIGTVTSATEADLRAEAGGRVTAVYAKLGDFVSAGRIIAETENSAQRASVLQAEGSLDSAKANLAKVLAGDRSEDVSSTQASAASAEAALAQSRIATVNSLKATYNTNDDLIHTKLDVVFSNPRSSVPQFNITTADSILENAIENERLALQTILSNQTSRALTLDEADDLEAEIARARTESQRIRDFIDDVAEALSKGIPTTNVSQSNIDAYSSTASAARSTMAGSLSSLSSTAQDLNAKKTAVITAQNSLAQTQTGARSEDVAAAEASVKQAQGSYNAALSSLEKTRVRAPISGTLNNLSVSVGDYMSPSQQVAVIANNNALEIVAHITEDDRNSVVVGSAVTIEGAYSGIVTKVASAIDPVTRKIETRIAISDETATLTNGQSVRVEISRGTQETTATPATNEPLSVPLASIKIEATRSIVFTVDAENKLIAHEVTLGPLVGNKIQISTGLTPEMMIVTDARGLKAGQEVSIIGATPEEGAEEIPLTETE